MTVDLPHPDGPSSDTNSPGAIARSAGPKAWTAPATVAKLLDTPLFLYLAAFTAPHAPYQAPKVYLNNTDTSTTRRGVPTRP